jgi:solute carrier family 25 carnitine/acylcarnitine transporter 20/29
MTAYPYWAHFASGCLAGLATFVISAPTEVVKCRAQVAQASSSGNRQRITSWQIAQDLWHERGVRGFYHGGVVTALRDGIGYGFYYLTYECSKDLWDRMLVPASAQDQQQGQASSSAVKILVCGGVAGVATWASIFPLDVIKTRVQTQELTDAPSLQRSGASQRRITSNERSSLIPCTLDESAQPAKASRKGAWAIARMAYRADGIRVFFRGIGVCCARAFVVNAVQWSVYEEVMKVVAAEAT